MYWDLLETNEALARKMAEKTATSYPSICEDVKTIEIHDGTSETSELAQQIADFVENCSSAELVKLANSVFDEKYILVTE